MITDLQGTTAVITGGASGIGLALARRAAAGGARVVIADIEPGALDAAAHDLGATTGAEVLAVRCDVASFEEVTDLARATTDAFGPVHLLCNNAGVGGGGPVATLTIDDWRWVLGVNLHGVVHGITAFLPGMLAHGEPAHIVNTASMAGLIAPAGMAPYAASKFAVVAISESLHAEMQAAATNVGVSVLCPGWVRTRIHESRRNRPADLGGSEPAATADPAAAAAIAAVIDSGMPPEQVADAVVDAVAAGRLHVLTHPEMLGAVQARTDAILADAGVSPPH